MAKANSAADDNDAVILVDSSDRPLGTAEKLDAHRRGLKHRAVSALVRNPQGLMLLQRRALDKYHSGGLWANACCSHPCPGENTAAAARRRLREEMGVDCALAPLFVTSYRAEVSGDLTENELVHVFGGTYDGSIAPNPAEVSEWKWIPLDQLMAEQSERPEIYTVWFRHYLREFGGGIAKWLQKPPLETNPALSNGPD